MKCIIALGVATHELRHGAKCKEEHSKVVSTMVWIAQLFMNNRIMHHLGQS